MNKINLGDEWFYFVDTEEEFDKLKNELIYNGDDYRNWSKYKGKGIYHIRSERSGMWDDYRYLRKIPDEDMYKFIEKAFDYIKVA